MLAPLRSLFFRRTSGPHSYLTLGPRNISKIIKKRYGRATEYHGAEAYGCIYVVADSLKRAKELTPAAIREAMAATDLMTAFGPVKFVSYGKKKQQNALPTYLVQWQKGILETVWPKNVATKPYVYPVPEWSRDKSDLGSISVEC